MSDRADRKLKRRLGVFVVVLGVLLSANNLLPYGGLRDDSCQTMFSSLEWWEGGNNHLLVPQHMLSDMWDGIHDVSVSLEPSDGDERVQDLEAWLSQPERLLNTEAVRVVVRQICDRGHRVTLTYRRGRQGALERSEDACREPRLSRPHSWIPVRLYETDYRPDWMP